jgi:hypothetical protein
MKLREVFSLEFTGAIIAMILGIQLGVAFLSLGAPRVTPVMPFTGHPDVRHSY